MFVKLCAANKPPLSPATMQVALSTNAKDLLQGDQTDKDFTKLAKGIIAKYASRQGIIKDVCTASDGEYAELAAQAKALGWTVDSRNSAPENGIVDPLMLVTILARTPQVTYKKPPNKANREANAQAITDMQANPIDPTAAAGALLKVKKAAVAKLLPLLPDAAKAQNANQLRTILGRPAADQMHDLSRLLDSLTVNVRTYQTGQLTALKNEYVMESFVRFTEQEISQADFVTAQASLTKGKQDAASGVYKKKT
jgi:hypothetical protein